MSKIEENCGTCGWWAGEKVADDESMDLAYCENVSSSFDGRITEENCNCGHWKESPHPAGRTQGSPLRPPVPDSPSPPVPDSPPPSGRPDGSPLLVGIGGKSGSGKDTAAAYLVEQGYFQLGFADCLKEVVGIAFDLDLPQLYGERREITDPRFGKSPRELMQALGTLFRAVWPEIWIYHVERVMAELEPQGRRRFVISDVRLKNEAEWIKSRGGVLVRLERSTDWKVCATQGGGEVGIPGHISEVDLDGWGGWNFVINNSGTVAELRENLDRVLAGNFRESCQCV